MSPIRRFIHISPYVGLCAAAAVIVTMLVRGSSLGTTISAITALAISVAGYLGQKGEKHGAKIERLQVNIAGVDSRGRPPKVKNSDPVIHFGVHRSISLPITPDEQSLNAQLPAYVGRDIDADIKAAFEASQFIIVQGPHSSGMSRAIFEAAAAKPSWSFIRPAAKGTSIQDILKDIRKSSGAIIFLEAVDEYITAGGLNACSLDSLNLPEYRKIVIVGTFSPTQETSSQVNAVLERATVIRIRPTLSEAEQRLARANARNDPRIKAALAQTREPFFQHLASGPAILNQVLNAADTAQPTAAAIVFAAVECRRLGLRCPLTRDLLYELHRAYVNAPYPEADFNRGMEWATKKIIGSASCLYLAGDKVYEPLPYLVQHATELLPLSSPPEGMINALLRNVEASTSQVSETSLRYSDQIEFIERTLEARSVDNPDDIQAEYLLGRLLCATGRPWEASVPLHKAANAGNVHAAYHLALACLQTGKDGEAMGWFRFVAYSRNLDDSPADQIFIDSMYHLGVLHCKESSLDNRKRGRAELLYAVRNGHVEARKVLLRSLMTINDFGGLCEIDREFATETGLSAITPKNESPSRDELEISMREKIIRTGDAQSMYLLGVLLCQTGRSSEGTEWIDLAASMGLEIPEEVDMAESVPQDQQLDGEMDRAAS